MIAVISDVHLDKPRVISMAMHSSFFFFGI
jgi:hypothetical protein